MIERTKKGYYRCTTLHKELYNEMLIAYSKYCTPTMLGMLQHEFSTQKNEAMNHSVATLAPKTKTFSKSSSLLTRVLLCGATQIVGHHEVWNRIFKKFNCSLDGNLSRHFQRKDAAKSKRQLLQKTKEYKAGRSKNRYVKYAEAHVSQLEDMKTGVMYQTGVAVKAAKKSVQKTALPRNPAGTLLKDWKCPYYHRDFCFITGHKDCRSEYCSMRGKRRICVMQQ